MKLQIGNGQKLKEWLDHTARLCPREREYLMRLELAKLGIEFPRPTAIKHQYSRDQECGFHWLLGQWLKLDPQITVNVERLKDQVLIAHFGVVRQVGLSGQETLIPVRRTTQEWDFEQGKYVRKKLSLDLYTGLIEFTYHIADPIELPEMLKKYRRAA